MEWYYGSKFRPWTNMKSKIYWSSTSLATNCAGSRLTKGCAAVRVKLMRMKQWSLDWVRFIPREKLCLSQHQLRWFAVPHNACLLNGWVCLVIALLWNASNLLHRDSEGVSMLHEAPGLQSCTEWRAHSSITAASSELCSMICKVCGTQGKTSISD